MPTKTMPTRAQRDAALKSRGPLSYPVAMESVQFITRDDGSDAGKALPPGVCGRMIGTCLTYGVIDTWGTTFAPGCLARTIAERVSIGKVQLFDSHDATIQSRKVHVGVVRSIVDVGNAAIMTADIFDTSEGRAMKEYLAAVLSAKSETGLSVGFKARDAEWVEQPDGDEILEFRECELRHVAVTPINSVPDTNVLGVRAEDAAPGKTAEDVLAASPYLSDDDNDVALLRRTLRRIIHALPEADARAEVEAAFSSRPGAAAPTNAAADNASGTAPDATAAPAATPTTDPAASTGAASDEQRTQDDTPKIATMDERLAAVRRVLAMG